MRDNQAAQQPQSKGSRVTAADGVLYVDLAAHSGAPPMTDERLIATLLTRVELDSARAARRPSIVIVSNDTDFLPAAVALKMNGSTITVATLQSLVEPRIRKHGLAVIRLGAPGIAQPGASSLGPQDVDGEDGHIGGGAGASAQAIVRDSVPCVLPACMRLGDALQMCSGDVFSAAHVALTEAYPPLLDAESGMKVKPFLTRGFRGMLLWDQTQVQRVLTVLLALDERGRQPMQPQQLSCELGLSLQVRCTRAQSLCIASTQRCNADVGLCR